MTFPEAIKLAAKKGWMKGKMNGQRQQLAYLQEPHFWVALGAALNLPESVCDECGEKWSEEDARWAGYHDDNGKGNPIQAWKYLLFQYSRALAEGREEEFWAQLTMKT